MLRIRYSVIFLLLTTMLPVIGCSYDGFRLTRQLLNKTGTANSQEGHISKLSPAAHDQDHDQNIAISIFNGASYVPLNKLATVLGFNTKWQASESVLLIGDCDAAYEWKADSDLARKGEENVKLQQPPILRNSMLFLPVSALFVFEDEMNYELTDSSVNVHLSSTPLSDAVTSRDITGNNQLGFADDPDDPNKANGISVAASAKAVSSLLDEWKLVHENAMLTAARKTDMNKLITKAKAYLGVKYEFGALPYPQSGTFDSSSFTQYVFGRNGINLARTARGQALQGAEVNRKSLRKGDLLFFCVPGHYRTNKTVGRAAVYLGGSLMLHVAPKPLNGVQITNMNTAYWEQTFLFARRVVSS